MKSGASSSTLVRPVGALGGLRVDLAHRLRVQPGAAVLEVVAGDAGDGGVVQVHRDDRLADAARLVAVQRLGLAGVDLAEVAAPGALVAADEEGRLAVLPALEDVGTARLLADRVQPLALHQLLQLVVLGAHLRPGLDPLGLALDGGLAVPDLQAQHLASVGCDCGHVRLPSDFDSSANSRVRPLIPSVRCGCRVPRWRCDPGPCAGGVPAAAGRALGGRPRPSISPGAGTASSRTSRRCCSTTGSTSAIGHLAAQLVGERGHTRVADPARHDPVEPGVVGVHVEGEAVHRDALGDADADRRELAVLAALAGVGGRVLGAVQARVELLVVSAAGRSRGKAAELRALLDRVAEDPHPAAALDAGGLQAEVGAGADQGLLQAAHVRDHVHRARELLDRVADQLAGAVPGDLAAAVDVDDRGAVEGALAVLPCAGPPCRPAGAPAAGRCRGSRRRSGPRAPGAARPTPPGSRRRRRRIPAGRIAARLTPAPLDSGTFGPPEACDERGAVPASHSLYDRVRAAPRTCPLERLPERARRHTIG